MTTRLRVDGAAGKVAIYDTPSAGVVDDGPLNSPLSHLDRIRYHSDLSYFEIAASYTGTLSIPATATPADDDMPRNHLVTSHSLGFVPFGVMMIDGAQISPFEPVFFGAGGRNIRCLSLVVTSTQWYVREYQWIKFDLASAQSFQIDVFLFRTAPTNTTTKILDINPTTGRVILGKGQIDNQSRYLKESASPDFYMTAGRTVDTYLNTIKVFRPDGSTLDWNSYGGSFSPPAVIGVSE